VEPARPTFRWSPQADATHYQVSIYDQELNRVAQSGLVTNVSWQPDAPLKRGAVYQWEVVAYREGQDLGKAPKPPAPEAKFRVLEEAQLREIEAARRESGSSHLALGVVYTRAGLLQEAERELDALARSNPDSPLARRLLQQIRSLRKAR